MESMIKIREKLNREFTSQNISSKRNQDRDRELEMKSQEKQKQVHFLWKRFCGHWLFLFSEKRKIIITRVKAVTFRHGLSDCFC